MLYRNRCFFMTVLMLGGMLIRPAVAAPTVKRLDGAVNSNVYGNNVNRGTQAKSLTSPQVASSGRALSLNTKSAPKSTSGTKTTTTVPKTTAVADSARAPGLHGNLVKGISSKLSSNYTQPSGVGNTSDLTQRVIDLEAAMPTKQIILEPGDGIVIDGNTISLSQEMMNLPEQIDEINQAIDDLNEQIETPLPSNYYTVEQTQDYLQDNYYDKDYVDQVVNQLSNMNVANNFDPGFLTQGQ